MADNAGGPVVLPWFKLASNFHTHHKGIRAGRLGREVFIYLLGVNALHSCDGEIPVGHGGTDVASHLLQSSQQEVEEGLRLAEAAGLIRVEVDHIIIVGWDDDWRPPLSSTERTRRQRKRERSDKKHTDRAPKSTVRDEVGRSETPRDVAKVSRDGWDERDAIEESRGEESRVDKTTAGSPPAKSSPPRKPAAGDHPLVIARFDELYSQRYEKRPTWGAKQGKMVQRLLKAGHNCEEICGRMLSMFERPPKWLEEPFDLQTFVLHFDKFVSAPMGSKEYVTGDDLREMADRMEAEGIG